MDQNCDISTWQVLIVDDNMAHAELLRLIFTAHKVNVTVVTDAWKALALLRDSPQLPTLLLLDLVMPGLSGQDMLNMIQVQGTYNLQMCVVAITATDLKLVSAPIDRPHIHAVFRKPLQFSRMIEALKVLVCQPETRQHLMVET
jgi:CheY-like chemotaxis protein